MKELYQKIKEHIENADAILIGASNGLSISEGYNIFADDNWFQENFSDFRSSYGIHSILEGSFYHFPSVEAKWAFSSRLISRKCYQEEPSQMMKDLHALVSSRDCFVVTSNTEDHFIPAGFSREQVFEMEGRMTQSRCASDCCEDVYENREDVLRMAKAEKNGLVPSELIPRCPRCGSPMTVNFADSQLFFQTRQFQNKMQDYQNFVRKYRGKNLVILEFGVGWRNRMIKEPLMQLTASEPNAVYITFNKGEIYIPNEISDRSIGVDGDITEALREILISSSENCCRPQTPPPHPSDTL